MSLYCFSSDREKLTNGEKGIDQWQIAQRLGICKSLLSKFDRGRREIPEDLKQRLIAELGIKQAWARLIAPAQFEAAITGIPQGKEASGLKPGQDYNDRADDVLELLHKHRWKVFKENGTRSI